MKTGRTAVRTTVRTTGRKTQRTTGRAGLASMAAFVLVAVTGCGGAPPQESTPPEPPDPVKVLQQMSDTLSQATQLTFKATRELDAALVEVTGRAEKAEIEVWVSRPDKARAHVVSDAGARSLFIDGTHVSLLDESMNLYASSPVAGTIDDVIDALADKYGFTPPMAEFIVNAPYKRFSAQIQTSVHRGVESVDGEPCDHVSLAGEVADADLWISSGDHLPRRFIATFKDREGNPQLKIAFSGWNLAASVDPSQFAFEPPKDAEKIVMTTVQAAAAAAAEGKGGTK